METKRGYFERKEGGKVEFVEDPSGPICFNKHWESKTIMEFPTSGLDPIRTKDHVEENENKTLRELHGLPQLTNPTKHNPEETTYDLINYEPLDLINDLKNKYNTVTIIKLKNKSKLNIIKYRRS